MFPFWEFSISLRLPRIQTDSPKRQKIFRAGSCRFFLGVSTATSPEPTGHLDRAKWIVIRDRPRVRPVDSRRAALSAPFTSVGIPSASPSTDIVVRSSPFFFPSSSSPSHPGGCASPQQTLSRSTCSAPLAACAGGAMESIDSSGFSGSGPGALCVHMYVFAGVTASVSRNIP